MKSLIGALLLLALIQPNTVLADRGARAAGYYPVSGAVVVGGAYGRRGGYYGPRWGYPAPSVGVYFGGPVGWGGPWGPPVYYPQPIYPPVVAVPPAVVYVERGERSTAREYGSGEALEPGYWYYCRENAGYFPAVTQCPGSWEQVAPRPD
ncbi:hypothetical protein [Candidatus Accumulibacter sp. ACC007]|uniref:hypothetical protein n=1 Tax=Candidatus Accumulibacter sp. ACC007 TaxID=2823333 RepID=UPI0025C67782|nr:hypothetical protein [Candidatus Accumulibacter sp. ACC007]